MPYFMKTKLAIGDGGITSLKKKITAVFTKEEIEVMKKFES